MIDVMILIRDSRGNLIGSATELEIVAGINALEVFLTIAIPGRGSLFAHEMKEFPQPGRAAIWNQVRETGQSWVGELPFVATSGPASDKRGVVLAGTGEFAGVRGTMFQTSTMRLVTVDGWRNDVCETFELTWPT
jgi:hypothetical protein